MSSSGVDAAGQKPTTPESAEQPLVDHPPEHRLRIVEQVACGCAHDRVGEVVRDIDRIAPTSRRTGLQLIRSTSFSSGNSSNVRTPRKLGRGGADEPLSDQSESRRRAARASVERSPALRRLASPSCSRRTSAYSARRAAANVSRVDESMERACDADCAGRIDHVHDRAGVGGVEPHRGVRPGGGRAADEERQAHSGALHLAGHDAHLFERWRDEPGQPDEVACPPVAVSRIRVHGTMTPRSMTS